MRLAIIALLTILSSSVSTSINAEAYVGMGIGSASYKVNLGVDGNFEEKGTGTKLYGGYTFNKFFALEAAAYNFAEASVGAFETSPGGPIVTGAAASMKGVSAYAVAMYPVSKKFSLIAKLGALSWNADLSANGNSRTNDGTNVAYAVAASYGFTKEFLAVAEWESFDSDNPELAMLSVGFKFIFR